MQNVEMEVKGNKLTITVDLKQDFGRSKTGKSKIVASTLGIKDVPGTKDVRIGLNVFRPTT